MADRYAIEELHRKLREERDRLLAQAEALSEEAAERIPVDAQGQAQWTAKEQLSHLTEMETTYRAWVEKALREENPDLAPVRGEPVAIPLEEANRHPVAEHVAELRRQREVTRRLIEGLTPEHLERVATHPLFGTLTVMQWLRSYYRHDRMHIDQLAGREPSYRPRFLDGTEPDQRASRLDRRA
jgi:hypothetical protein